MVDSLSLHTQPHCDHSTLAKMCQDDVRMPVQNQPDRILWCCHGGGQGDEERHVGLHSTHLGLVDCSWQQTMLSAVCSVKEVLRRSRDIDRASLYYTGSQIKSNVHSQRNQRELIHTAGLLVCRGLITVWCMSCCPMRVCSDTSILFRYSNFQYSINIPSLRSFSMH